MFAVTLNSALLIWDLSRSGPQRSSTLDWKTYLWFSAEPNQYGFFGADANSDH